jgi:peptidoglycan/LPS O-acetylase OafA/YrhL
MTESLLTLTLLIALLAVFWLEAKAGLKFFGGKRPPVARPEAQHLAGVDGLRGVLALSVFVHHASCLRNLALTGHWYPPNEVFGQMGRYAVTLFFFITGFLFWTKLQKNPRPGIMAHLRSRISRLGPAYWASVVAILAIVAILSHGERRESVSILLKHVGSWFLFTLPGLADVNGIAETSRIDASVTWTLRLEWVFYAIVPFCGWFAAKFWRTGLFLLGIVALAKFVLPHLTFLGHFPRVESFTLNMMFYLMTVFSGGILCAAMRPWARSWFPEFDFRRIGFSLVGLGLICAIALFGPLNFGSMETLGLIVPFFLIVLGNDWSGYLTSAPAIFLGKISYSIYLLHGIVLFVTWRVLNHVHPIATIPAALYWPFIGVLGAVVIAVSALWYRLFEAPFLRTARSVTTPKTARAAA